MDKLIGRKAEIKEFNKYINSGSAEFIAVYGRRRIGKTFLVRSIFKNSFAFETTGIIDGNRDEQMSVFVNSLRNIGFQGKTPQNWIEAFEELRKLLEPKVKESDERVVVFIDELPCFETQKSGFLKAFANFWNSWANWQDNVMLIVCGSATSWMVDNLVNNHSGLYDRLTHQIHLRQFTLQETMEYFNSKGYGYSKLLILHIYMAFGGVPYYLRYFNKGESFAQAVDRLFFADGVLKNEFGQMFSSLFKQPEVYVQVLKAMSKPNSGLTRQEINEKLKKYDNGHLTKVLSDLEKCDFIRRFNTIGKNNKIKTSSCFYQLVDFYTIFYFTFADYANSNPSYWQSNLGSPSINNWCGLALERVVMSHIGKIKDALGISNVQCEFYSWRSKDLDKNVQIDMVLDRADGIINICEVKYSANEFVLSKDEYFKIQRRASVFKSQTNTKSTVLPTLITSFGAEPNGYANDISVQIDLDDLF